MLRILILGLAVAALGNRCAGQTLKDAELRIWTDIRGNEITARLSRYKEGIVYLRTNLRQNLQTPPNQLSKKDQDYIVEILKKSDRTKDAEEFSRLTKSSLKKSGQTKTGRYGSGSAAVPSSSDGQPPAGGALANPRGSPGSVRGGSIPSSDNQNSGFGNQAGGGGRGFSGGSPIMSPAGDGPVVSGPGNSRQGNGRAPSQYTRSPEDEQADLGRNPNRPLKQFDPFSESSTSRTASAKESSANAAADSRSFGGNRNAVPANANVDPFADLASPAPKSSTNGTESTDRSSEAAPTRNYQPPVLSNGTTQSVPTENGSAGSAAPENSKSGWSGTSLILLAIGIVGFLFLVMIGLLLMVLAKSNQMPHHRQARY